MLNEALADAIRDLVGTIDERVRRIVREELAKVSAPGVHRRAFLTIDEYAKKVDPNLDISLRNRMDLRWKLERLCVPAEQWCYTTNGVSYFHECMLKAAFAKVFP